ncbi:hypothetical protein [Rhizobium sp. YTU87027]|uniref:hypothetical protein n=1 Tax=Rhizobium sp. YTU87027 TaxID=3417741 RepID=UPI003D686AC3
MIEFACFGAIELKGLAFVKRARRDLSRLRGIAAQTRFTHCRVTTSQWWIFKNRAASNGSLERLRGTSQSKKSGIFP